MGGIIGRLFREFAVTLSSAILVSMVISLTTTPMMCSRVLIPEKDIRHGRVYTLERARCSANVLRGYRAQPAIGCWIIRRCILIIFVAHAGPERLSAITKVPKGFFPQQDTGVIDGWHAGSAGHVLHCDA